MLASTLRLPFDRMAIAFRDALATAFAGAVAWVLAIWLWGHTHPVFAMVTAIVCLAPGLPNHGRQAAGIMLGVALGIAVGEVALLIPDTLLDAGPLALVRMSGAVLVAILVASAFGLPAVVPIQAGVSAVLVLAMGAEHAGWNRMEDVLVGTGVGLLFSQVLLTPNPLRQIDHAMRNLLLRIGSALEIAGDATARVDAKRAEAAVAMVMRAQEDLALLRAGVDSARYSARWSLRGRLVAKSVTAAADQSEHDAIHICAAALLLSSTLHDALGTGAAPPEGLASRLTRLAALCAQKTRQGAEVHLPAPVATDISAPVWASLTTPLHLLETTFYVAEASRPETDTL